MARSLLVTLHAMPRRLRLLPFVLLLAASPASALKPGKHRDLLEKACAAQDLPQAFCRRAGKQVYETDFLEWTDLSAHAQRELGEDACSAADAAVVRVDRLARAMVEHFHAHRYEEAAVELGRAIHTLQDECAHHGMTNQEHAFLSMEQECGDDLDTSPDIQPAAIACASERTTAALQLAAAALAGDTWNGVDLICVDFDQRDVCANAALPSPIMACEFLAEHHAWDGTDSTWHTTRVGDALMRAFADGLAGAAGPAAVCGTDPDAIAPQAPHPTVTDRDVGCTLTDIACLGKADEGGESAAPEHGGCASGLPSGGVLALGLLALRPRRRATRA